MVQVLLGLMLKWYYLQMTLQCYVFVEDWMSSNRGGARKKLWKLLFAEFFDYSIFCVQFLLEKNEINVAGKKSWNFCSDLYTFVELFGSAFRNEQKKLYAIFLWRRLTVLLRKMLSVPFDVVLCSKVNFCGKKEKFVRKYGGKMIIVLA